LGDHPEAKAVYDLEAQVQSLNQTVEALKTQIPKKPKFLTVDDSSIRVLPSGEWVDLVSISDVAVWEGANVLAIATVELYGGTWGFIRHRANDTYGESYQLDDQSYSELHYVWTNLMAGTYTFAIQGTRRPEYEVSIRNTRLTIIIT
ncbi:MAG: hypothetical protein ACE5J3_14685, partial [Methanosarcinales archaeon]